MNLKVSIFPQRSISRQAGKPPDTTRPSLSALNKHAHQLVYMTGAQPSLIIPDRGTNPTRQASDPQRLRQPGHSMRPPRPGRQLPPPGTAAAYPWQGLLGPSSIPMPASCSKGAPAAGP